MPRLGAEELSAYVLRLDSGALVPLRNARVKWGRENCAPAPGSVTIAASYSYDGRTVRDDVPEIRKGVDELVIYRSRPSGPPQRIWRGPASGWQEIGGLLTLNAFCELARPLYQPVPVADEYDDVALITGRLLATQLAAVPGFDVDYRPCGVKDTYRVTNGRRSFTLDALKGLSAKVDYSCVGDVLVVRGVDDYDSFVDIGEGDLAQDVTSSQDFTQVPDQVICYGKEQVVGVYPPDAGLHYAGPTPLCKSIENTELLTETECVSYARSTFEALQATEGLALEIPNNATLSPDTAVDIDDLVPGRLFRVAVEDRLEPIPARLFKLVSVSGQQGNASDNRPRQPNGSFDGADETRKEYVGVTLQAYAPAPTVLAVSGFAPTGARYVAASVPVLPGQGT